MWWSLTQWIFSSHQKIKPTISKQKQYFINDSQKGLGSRGCSSVVERVLRMYEAPGSTPGSSICSFFLIPSGLFLCSHLKKYVGQWTPLSITPFLLHGAWCHQHAGVHRRKKEEIRKRRKGRTTLDSTSSARSTKSAALTDISLWVPFGRISKQQDRKGTEI